MSRRPEVSELGRRERERYRRRSKKIEDVTDALIRDRIEKIKPKSVRTCVKYLYVIDGRVSEAVTKTYKGDPYTTPRGPKGTDASMNIWYSPEYNTQADAMRAQRDDGVRRLFPVVVFKVATAKRRGRPRYCAVPLDPKYEPWTMELFKYFEDAGEEDVFSFGRQTVYRRSKKVWADLAYIIEDYSVAINSQGVITGIETERETKVVDRHLRTFTTHALRHLRASDLVNYYGFTGVDLSAFGGWTLSTSMRVSRSVDRYVALDWRAYFPKLLKPRYKGVSYTSRARETNA